MMPTDRLGDPLRWFGPCASKKATIHPRPEPVPLGPPLPDEGGMWGTHRGHRGRTVHTDTGVVVGRWVAGRGEGAREGGTGL